MTEFEQCCLCGRPLPPLRWYHYIPVIGWMLEPPPFHTDRYRAECQRAMRARLEGR